MVAAAVVAGSIGGALLSSSATKSAANTASSAQKDSNNQAIAQQDKQFQAIQQLLSPYVQAGNGALSAQQNLIGLNGSPAQQAAIDALKGSPAYQSIMQSGTDSILQNASATGGLRGGNTQAALGSLGTNTLAQLIQSQYANLGGLTSIGQNAAAGVGNAGMNNANNVSALLQQSGAATAGNALAAGSANAGLYNALGSGVGLYAGLGGFGSSAGAGYNAAAARAATSAAQSSAFGGTANFDYTPTALPTTSLLGPGF